MVEGNLKRYIPRKEKIDEEAYLALQERNLVAAVVLACEDGFRKFAKVNQLSLLQYQRGNEYQSFKGAVEQFRHVAGECTIAVSRPVRGSNLIFIDIEPTNTEDDYDASVYKITVKDNNFDYLLDENRAVLPIDIQDRIDLARWLSQQINEASPVEVEVQDQ